MAGPARIRVAQDADGFWTCREAVIGSQEYVRADLYAALEAQLAEAKASLHIATSDKLSLLEQRDTERQSLMAQIDYSCDLQRIIEDLCRGGPVREPKTSARRHYDMATEFLSALEATPAPMVTEELVERACLAYLSNKCDSEAGQHAVCSDDMRAALKAALTAAGFRIVGPGEVDPVTVEKCAEVADAEVAKHQGPFTSQPAYVASCAIRDALRALKETQG